MTESNYTRELLSMLRREASRATIVKLNDRLTAGLPDFFISLDGRVTWFECKLLARATEFSPAAVGRADKRFRLQFEFMKKLQRAHIVVFTSAGHALTRSVQHIAWDSAVSLALVSMRDLVEMIKEEL